MYEREENAQFSLISYSKERRFRVFQTLPDSWKNKKLLQVLTWFLKLGYYRDYLGNIWRNSKIHDCQPILENYRHWLLRNIYVVINYATRCPSLQYLQSNMEMLVVSPKARNYRFWSHFWCSEKPNFTLVNIA